MEWLYWRRGRALFEWRSWEWFCPQTDAEVGHRIPGASPPPFKKHLLGLWQWLGELSWKGRAKALLLGEVAACAVCFNQWWDMVLWYHGLVLRRVRRDLWIEGGFSNKAGKASSCPSGDVAVSITPSVLSILLPINCNFT